jgi:soluble lytic murein transglycosylase-like protein
MSGTGHTPKPAHRDDRDALRREWRRWCFGVAIVGCSGLACSVAAGADDPPRLVLASAAPQAASTISVLPAKLSAASGVSTSGMPNSYRALVRQEAARAGIPPDLADAVAEVESGYHPGVVGGAGEVGLMQVMPSTARMLGFTGTNAELAQPEVNARYGVAYLARAWRLAGQDICTATMKYRAGHGETRFSYLSVDYCIKVRTKLSARGYPVTGTVPAPTFGARGSMAMATSGGRRAGRVMLGGGRGLNLDSLNRQLRVVAEAANAHAIRLAR